MLLFANELKNNYEFEKAEIIKMIPIKKYGLEESYGGNLHSFLAQLKNGLILILNKNLKTVGTFIDIDNLENIDLSTLKLVAKINKITDSKKISKDDLISKIKGGEINE